MTPTLEEIEEFFRKFGSTDNNYLRTHYNRFRLTKEFVLPGEEKSDALDICDVGSHWLHNAYLYAIDGHRLYCVDQPLTFVRDSVVAAASEMGAKLYPLKYLDRGDGLSDLPESSMDIVLMCEVLEHLAFNPIPFWKQVYRVLRPGGRIMITTPNANYFRTLQNHYARLKAGKGWGITLERILLDGTFGHHWKEWTLGEIKELFAALSDDFVLERSKLINVYLQEECPPDFEFKSIGDEVGYENVFVSIQLKEKVGGIKINPPWVPLYD